MHNERIMSSPSEAECSAVARVSAILDATDRDDPDSDPKGIIHMLNLNVIFFGEALSGNVDVAWSGRVDRGTRGYAQYRGFDNIGFSSAPRNFCALKTSGLASRKRG